MGLYELCCSTATHRGVVYAVWKSKERLGLSEEDCIKLSRAFDLREESDYGIFRQISKDEAERLNDAKDFVEKLRKLL